MAASLLASGLVPLASHAPGLGVEPAAAQVQAGNTLAFRAASFSSSSLTGSIGGPYQYTGLVDIVGGLYFEYVGYRCAFETRTIDGEQRHFITELALTGSQNGSSRCRQGSDFTLTAPSIRITPAIAGVSVKNLELQAPRTTRSAQLTLEFTEAALMAMKASPKNSTQLADITVEIAPHLTSTSGRSNQSNDCAGLVGFGTGRANCRTSAATVTMLNPVELLRFSKGDFADGATIDEGDTFSIGVETTSRRDGLPGVNVPIEFFGASITDTDIAPLEDVIPLATPNSGATATFTVKTDDVYEGTEKLEVRIDESRLLPLYHVPQSGRTAIPRAHAANIADTTNPIKAELTVTDDKATEQTLSAPGPGRITVGLKTELTKLAPNQRLEIPILYSGKDTRYARFQGQNASSGDGKDLELGTDFELELVPAPGASLSGNVLVLDGSAGASPTAEIIVHALHDQDSAPSCLLASERDCRLDTNRTNVDHRDERLSLSLPTSSTSSNSEALVLSARGFGIPVTGAGSGTITFVDDDASFTSFLTTIRKLRADRRTFQLPSPIQESQFQEVGNSGVSDFSFVLDLQRSNAQLPFYIPGHSIWNNRSDTRGAFVVDPDASNKTIASELALRGGTLTIGNRSIEIGPSIELQNAPAGMVVQRLERIDDDEVFITLRMSEAAQKALNAQRVITIKVGGMLFGGGCVLDHDLSTHTFGDFAPPRLSTSRGSCVPAFTSLTIVPDKDLVIEHDGEPVLGDTTGDTYTYSVRLAKAPSHTVTVTPATSDANTVAVSDPVVFQPSDRGDALTKTITLTTQRDDAVDNPGGSDWPDVTISHSVTTSDAFYTNATPSDFTVDLVDDEPTTAFLSSPSSFTAYTDRGSHVHAVIVEGGQPRIAAVRIVLSRAPGAGETFIVPLEMYSDTGFNLVDPDAEVTLVPVGALPTGVVFQGAGGATERPTLTFSHGSPTTVNLRLQDNTSRSDADTAPDRLGLRFAGGPGALLDAGLEGGLKADGALAGINVVHFDSQTPQGIVASDDSLELGEGASTEFTVRLAQRVTSLVTVNSQLSSTTLSASELNAIKALAILQPNSSPFRASAAHREAWFKPRTHTVTVAEDDDIYDHDGFDVELTIGNDSSTTVRVPAEIIDDDPPAGTLSLNTALIDANDFTRSGSSGPFRHTLGVTLGGHYVFAGVKDGGFSSGTTRAHCGTTPFTAQRPCRYLASGSAALGAAAPSLEITGGPEGLSVANLQVEEASGGTTAVLTLELTEAGRTALTDGAAVTLRIGGTLIDGAKNRFGQTPVGSTDALCADAVSLADPGRCPPTQTRVLLLPSVTDPVDAAFVVVPDDLTLTENSDGSGTAIKVGSPVIAADYNGDAVTYSVQSPAGFAIDSGGQITYTGTGVDRESTPQHQITVTVAATSTGADGTATAVTQELTVDIEDVNEGHARAVLREDAIGRTGSPLHLKGLEDDPEGVSDLSTATYLWQTSTDSGTTWTAASNSGNTGSFYTVAPADAGNLLRVTVGYTDDAGNPESVASDPVEAYSWPQNRFGRRALQATMTVTDSSATEGDSDDPAVIAVRLPAPLLPCKNERYVMGFEIEGAASGASRDYTVKLVAMDGGSLEGVSFRENRRFLNGKERFGVVITFEPPTNKPSQEGVDVEIAFNHDDDIADETYTGLREIGFLASGITATDFCSDPALAVLSTGSVDTAEFTVKDDDAGKTVSFTNKSATVDEGDSTAGTLGATLTVADTTVDGGVTVTMVDGSAVHGSEFRYTGDGTLTTSGGRRSFDVTWSAGASTVTLPVELIADTADELATKRFTMELSNPVGVGAIGAQRTMTVDIADDDPTLVSISGGGIVHEGETPAGGPPTFTVRLGRPLGMLPDGTAEYVEVHLDFAPFDAGFDWELATGADGVTAVGLDTAEAALSFTATAGKTVQEAQVELRSAADDVDSDHEPTTVSVPDVISNFGSERDPVVVDSLADEAAFLAVDDEATTAQLVAAPTALSLLDGGSDGVYWLALATRPTGAVTVTVTSSDTGAASLVAQTPPATGPTAVLNNDGTLTVTWPQPSGSSDARWQVPVPVGVHPQADADTSDESVTVTHTVSGYGSVASGPQITVDVTDPAVSVAPATDDDDNPLLFAEGADVTFIVSLGLPAAADVTVPWTLSDGRSMSSDPAYSVATGSADGTGADYTSTAGSVVISKGARTATITVATTDDAVYEGDHYFTVTLGTPTAASGTAPALATGAASAVGIIADVADRPHFCFSRSSYSTEELDGTVEITLLKRAARTQNCQAAATAADEAATLVPATVTWSTRDNSATAGEDYVAVAGEKVVFAPGDVAKTIEVTILDDLKQERSETLRLFLAVDDHGELVPPRSSVVTIVSGAEPRVSLHASRTEVTEGSFIGVEVRSDSATASFAYTVPVVVKTQGGTGSATDVRLEGTASFAKGSSSRTSTLKLWGVSDELDEGAETLTIELGTLPEGIFAGDVTELVITVNDPDPPDVLPHDSPLIPDGVGLGESFRLLFSSTAKTAATSSDIDDYNSVVQRDASGVDRRSIVPLHLAPYAPLFTAVAETAAVTAEANTSTESSDTDAPVYWVGGDLAAADYDDFYDGDWQSEDAPTDAAGIKRKTDTADLTEHWTGIAFGTGAGAGHPLGTTGADAASVAYGKLDDATSGIGPLRGSRGASSAQRRLYGLSPVFTVEEGVRVADASAAEGSAVSFTVTVPGGGASDVTVPYTLTDGRGVSSDPAGAVATGSADGSGADYTNAAGSIVVTAGTTTGTISVPTTDDAVFEGDHYFTVTLGTPTVTSGDAPPLSSTSGSATGAITDAADRPTVVISQATVTAAEGSNATVTVAITGTRAVDVEVAYATQAGTATAGADFTATPGTLTLASGAASGSFTVPILDDADDEPAESFTAAISATSSALVGTPSSAAVSIIDTDLTVVSLAGGGALLEGDANTTVEVTVSLGRALAAGEVVAVPLVLSSSTGAVVAGNGAHVSVALKAAQTGVALSGAATATPVLTFTGAQGSSASSGVLVLAAAAGVDDGDTANEAVTVALGNRAAFNSQSGTMIGGGAGPHATAHTATLDIADNDSLTVALGRTDSGMLTEGASAAADREAVFTVTLGRALIAGESYEAALAISGTGVTADDFTLAAASGQGVNTGVTLDVSSPLAPELTFDGAGARTATLVLTVADDAADEPRETLAVGLGTLDTPLTDAGDADRDGNIGVGETATAASAVLVDNDATVVTLAWVGGAEADYGVAEHTRGLLHFDTPLFQVSLTRPLVAGESMTVPLSFAGAAPGDGLAVICFPLPPGVSCGDFTSGSSSVRTVTFTGPTAASSSAQLLVQGAQDDDEVDESVTVTVAASSQSGSPRITAAGLDGGATGTGSVGFEVDDDDNNEEISVKLTGGGSIDVETSGSSTEVGIELSRPLVAGEALEFRLGLVTEHNPAHAAEPSANRLATACLPNHDGTGVCDVDLSWVGAGLEVNEGISAARYTISDTAGDTALVLVFTGSDDVEVQSATLTFASTGSRGSVNIEKLVTITTEIEDDEKDVFVSFGLDLADYDDGDDATLHDAATAVLVADDDDSWKTRTISLAAADGTALSAATFNEGDSYTFKAVLNDGITGPVVVPLAYTHTSTSADDFSALPASVLIPYGATEAEITITAAADNTSDDVEVLRVAGGDDPPGYAFAASTGFNLTVEESSVAVTATAAQVTEGTAASFTVELVEAPSADVTVNLSVAEAGGDFVDAADEGNDKSVVVKSGATSAVFTVPTTGDSVDEAVGAITVTVLAGDGYMVRGTPSASVTVNDDDPTEVTLSGGGTATEADTSTTVEVTVSLGRTLAATETVEVPLSIAGVAAGDFTLALKTGDGINTGVMLAAAGTLAPKVTLADAGAQTAVLLFAAAQDQIDEGASETATITLGDLSAGTLETNVGGGAQASDDNNPATDDNTVEVEITDDDAVPTVSLMVVSSVSESGAAVPVTAALSHPSDTDVVLTVSSSGAAAALSQNKTLTISAGATTSTGDVTLDPAGDTTDTADREVTVSAAVTGRGVAAPADAVLAVTDDDATEVTLSGGGTVTEADTATTVEVEVTLGRALVATEKVEVPLSIAGAGVVAGELTLSLKTGDGINTGVTLADGGTLAPKVTFANAGAQTAVLLFAAADDSVDEGASETATVTLGNLGDRMLATNVGGGAEASDDNDPNTDDNTVEVTITDDDETPVATLYYDGDYDGMRVGVPADWPLLPAGVGPGDQFRLIFVTSSQRDATDAEIGAYDQFVRSAAAGGHSSIAAHARWFRVLASTPTVDARDHTATTYTADDKGVPIYWLDGSGADRRVADDYEDFYDGSWANEGVPRSEAGVKVGINAQGYWTGSKPDGTKVNTAQALGAGGDQSISRAVVFGRLNSSDKQVVPVGCSGSASCLADKRNMRPMYGLSAVFIVADHPQVSESGSAVEVEVFAELDRPSDQAVTLTVSASGAGASLSDNKVLAIAAGAVASTGLVTLTLAPDSADTPDREVTVSAVAQGGHGVAAPADAVLTVVDDDATEVTLSGGGTVTEADTSTTVEVTVVLSRALVATETVEVPLAIAGSGVAAGDLTLSLKTGQNVNTGVELTGAATLAPKVVLSGAGAKTAVLLFAAVADGVDEGDSEAATVTLGNLADSALDTSVGGGVVASDDNDPATDDNTAKITITDDDAPLAQFAQAAYTAGEASGSRTATVAVSLSPAPDAPVTVSYTVGGTATSGTDFTALSGTVRVGTSGTADIAVAVTDDGADEVAETVTLTLTDGADYNLGALKQAAVAIADDDPTSVRLLGRFENSSSRSQVVWPEGASAGTREIDLTLGRALVADEVLEVPLVVTGAAVGSDFSLALKSGSPAGVALAGAKVTFTGSSGNTTRTATLVVTLLQDVDTADELVEVSLPAAWPSDTVASPATTVGGGAAGSGRLSFRIVDDDKPAVAGVEVSVRRMRLREGGAAGAYNVKLGADPGAGETVVVVPLSGDTDAATVAPAKLTFTGGPSGDWSTAQKVTVTPVGDADDDHQQVEISHSVSGYGAVVEAPAVTVVVTDDEDTTARGLAVLPAGLAANGFAGGEAQRVDLVPLGVSFAGAGGGGGRGDTSRNAGDRLWTATTGVLTAEGLGHITLSGAPAGLEIASARLVVNRDEEASASNKVTGADLVVELSHTGARIAAATTVTVTVAGALLARGVGASDPGSCDGVQACASVSGTLTISPAVPAVVIRPAKLDLAEGAAAGSYSVVLSTDPGDSAEVTVTPTSTDVGAVTVSGPLTFTGGAAGTWNTPQTVTVTPADDGDAIPETVTVTNAVAGYPSVTTAPPVTVTVAEDDEAITVALGRTDSGMLTEGASAAADREAVFTVTLGRALIAGESYTVPLAVSGAGVTADDFALAAATGQNVNTGVTLDTSSPLAPAVT
ncbi:MAG: hypothetical protein OXI97_08760, partial [Acidimicrobiaceae bacterium]|nr:hypothetical protein [Acidimicrobiaceae bacterium]